MDSSSNVSFGSITTTGGKTRLSGTNSSIDTDGLVTALTNAKKLPAIRLENRITTNDGKVAALRDLRTLLSNINGAVEGLRNPPGALGQDGNLFEQKEAYLTSSSAAQPATIAGVAASNRAQPGSFKLVVEQLATAAKLSSSSVDGLAQKLADKFGAFAGSIQLGTEGGTSAEIVIDGTMTIQDVRNAINSRTATTGVTASVLQVASGDVRMVLTAKQTGAAITLGNNAAGDDVLSTLGLSDDAGATPKNSIQAAQPARFTIDGVLIERRTNKVDDALQGVTLNLFKSEPGTTVTVEIERSLGAVEEKISSLVDAYNAFRDFVTQQNKVSLEGNVASDSPLFGNSLLREVQNKVMSVIGGAATGIEGGSLREIGITLDSASRMQLDQSKLGNALLTKLDRVRDILEFRYESSSADLVMSARKGTLQDTQFSVAITDDDQDGQIESATIDGVAVDVIRGKVIKGREGRPYAGLEFIWAGTGTTSIDVRASQGIADKAYDELGKILDLTEGRLTGELEQIQGNSTKARTDIDKINERADRYRDQLIIRFSALETALGQANSMLQQIRAAFGQNQSN